VLTLDGGGVRGVYTASLLHQLALRIRRITGNSVNREFELVAQFNIIVGTSTGSIIAAALAAGVPLERVVEMYRSRSKEIFQSPQPLQRGGCLDKARGLWWAIRHGLTAANRPHPLSEALASVLQDATMREVYDRRRIALCVPAV